MNKNIRYFAFDTLFPQESYIDDDPDGLATWLWDKNLKRFIIMKEDDEGRRTLENPSSKITTLGGQLEEL